MNNNLKIGPPYIVEDDGLTIDGFAYANTSIHINVDGSLTRSVACIKRKSENCKASGCIKNGFYYPHHLEHSHLRDPFLKDKKKSRKRMKDLASIRFIKPKQLYDSVMKDEYRSLSYEKPYAQQRRGLQKMICKLQYEKTKLKFKPKSFEGFAVDLRSIYNQEQLRYGPNEKYILQSYSEKFEINEKQTAINIYIYDKQFFDEICCRSRMIFIDATYSAVPKLKNNPIQLLTIMIKETNPATNISMAVPVIWVLMDHKTTLCYLKVFQFIKNNFPSFTPIAYMSDFESAIHNAIKKIYPEIIAKHCYFHFTQAIFKNARKLKLISMKKNKNTYPERFIVINQITSLALLAPSNIKIMYEYIKKEVIKDFGSLFNRFFLYFEKFWLKRITSTGFSVNNFTEDRTNNFIESYHRNILNSNLTKNPHPNEFITKLKYILRDARVDMTNINNKNNEYQKREKKKKTQEQNNEILKFWENTNKINCNEIEGRAITLSKINQFSSIKHLNEIEDKLIVKDISNAQTEQINESQLYSKTDNFKIIESDIELKQLFKFIRRRHPEKISKKKVLILNREKLTTKSQCDIEKHDGENRNKLKLLRVKKQPIEKKFKLVVKIEKKVSTNT